MNNEEEIDMNENEKKYGTTRLQVRTKFGHRILHIQGIGPIQVNREYGMAMDLRAPDDVVEWLSEQVPHQKSAASAEDYYVELIVRKYDVETKDTTVDDAGNSHDGVYQFYIIGDEQLNWGEGAILDCNVQSYPVMSVIDFANQCDLVRICDGEPINTTGDSDE